MRIDYSKPSADILKESTVRFLNEAKLYEEQKATSALLLKCSERKNCILCNMPLKGELFDHRGIPFILCKTCGHIQTQAKPPEGYPITVKDGLDFKKIYPRLSKVDYENRKKRIYKPKLDWAVKCLNELGYSSQKLKKLTWTDMGCGAGYFLSALKDFKADNISGFDADKSLIENGNAYLKEKALHFFAGSLAEGIQCFPADIYLSFFVLEHIDHSYSFFKELFKLKKGTVFIFSVPVFGFSCIVENIFSDNYARNLDCVIHTQIFTDESIRYAMRLSGFSIAAQWIFGQDSTDLCRIFTKALSDKCPVSLIPEFEKKIAQLTDPFQFSLDKICFSDQRHIIAIKN